MPRSFMNDGENELVVFEEFGGDPSLVNFQTVRVGSVCGNAYEGNDMELSCQGREISEIKFASFGEVGGACGSFEKGSCEASKDVFYIVQKECVGKESCSVPASEDRLGSASCDAGVSKRLVVEAVCN